MLWNMLLVCLMVTGSLAASSKRDDYSSSSSSGSSSVSFPSSSYSSSGGGGTASGYSSGSSNYASGSPTYTSGSSSYGSGSSAYGAGSSSYNSASKPYVSGGGSATGYSGSASSTSSVSSQPASQGNLYYYYYPVQPKPQDGSNYADSGSPQSSSYSSSASENYETNANSAFGNQVGSPNAGDYEAQESTYSGAVSPLDAANYGASLGGLQSYGGGGFASSLLGGTGYAAAASAPTGYAAAPSVAYAPSGYGGGLGSYGQQYGSYGYGQAPADYNGGKRFGLSSLIMPMLALAGLGLLIPTVTSLGSKTKKTKRSLNDSTSFASVGERLDRYLAIYRSATENEECVSRIICELGNTMTDVGGKSMILSLLEKVVPIWMKHKMGVFKNAVLSSDSGKCRKFKC